MAGLDFLQRLQQLDSQVERLRATLTVLQRELAARGPAAPPRSPPPRHEARADDFLQAYV